MDTNVQNKGDVKKAKAALRGLSEPERREVVSDALTTMPQIAVPIFCPTVIARTDFENDIDTIMNRVTISTVLSNFDGVRLNQGESFDVIATVKNCSTYELRDAELTATAIGSRFPVSSVATVTSNPPTFDIGVLGQGQVTDVTFECLANRETDGSQPLINLKLKAKPVFKGTTVATADGEIGAPD